MVAASHGLVYGEPWAALSEEKQLEIWLRSHNLDALAAHVARTRCLP